MRPMKFDMSEAWNEATAMIAANREVMLIIAGIFFFLPTLALSFALGGMQDMAMTEDPEAMEQALLSFYGSAGWMIILAFVVQIVGYLALLALLRDARKPTVGEAIKTGLLGVLTAVAAYFMLSIAMGLVFGAFIGLATASGGETLAAVVSLAAAILGAYTFVKTALVPPVIAIEKVYNPLKVLARSWRLTKGNSLRIAVFLALIVIVYFVISLLTGLVISAITFALGDTASAVVSGLISGVLGAVVAVVFVAVLAAIHRQLTGPASPAVSQTVE